jgi:hypothetical protein
MNATFPSDLLKEFYEEQTKSATTFTEIAELSDAYAALGRATAGSGIRAGRVTADASHDPSGGTSPSYRVVGDDLSAVRRREGPPDH